ncbi:hypothetical protein COLO4_32093 [Corchorus olitorius]|uniref:Uncharacterized protein n=1 Tax=Corchorus olitorius TaxID=93759 RepID=A0A1R3H1J9_9ROSI|nr:hypothetical protein COLO4_32093 [Corchorus olitorius]
MRLIHEPVEIKSGKKRDDTCGKVAELAGDVSSRCPFISLWLTVLGQEE